MGGDAAATWRSDPDPSSETSLALHAVDLRGVMGLHVGTFKVGNV